MLTQSNLRVAIDLRAIALLHRWTNERNERRNIQLTVGVLAQKSYIFSPDSCRPQRAATIIMQHECKNTLEFQKAHASAKSVRSKLELLALACLFALTTIEWKASVWAGASIIICDNNRAINRPPRARLIVVCPKLNNRSLSQVGVSSLLKVARSFPNDGKCGICARECSLTFSLQCRQKWTREIKLQIEFTSSIVVVSSRRLSGVCLEREGIRGELIPIEAVTALECTIVPADNLTLRPLER